MTKSLRRLNPRQRKFIAAYISDPSSPAKAYVKAGYSERTAHVGANALLQHPTVAAAVEASIRKVTTNAEVSVERILRAILLIAEADPRKFYDERGCLKPINELGDAEAAALASLDVEELTAQSGRERISVGQTKKIRLWDKTKALEMLGRYRAMFTDKVELGMSEDLLDFMEEGRERAKNARLK